MWQSKQKNLSRKTKVPQMNFYWRKISFAYIPRKNKVRQRPEPQTFECTGDAVTSRPSAKKPFANNNLELNKLKASMLTLHVIIGKHDAKLCINYEFQKMLNCEENYFQSKNSTCYQKALKVPKSKTNIDDLS